MYVQYACSPDKFCLTQDVLTSSPSCHLSQTFSDLSRGTTHKNTSKKVHRPSEREKGSRYWFMRAKNEWLHMHHTASCLLYDAALSERAVRDQSQSACKNKRKKILYRFSQTGPIQMTHVNDGAVSYEDWAILKKKTNFYLSSHTGPIEMCVKPNYSWWCKPIWAQTS